VRGTGRRPGGFLGGAVFFEEEKMSKDRSPDRSPPDDTDRPSEDDVARDRLGGPKGSPELKPAPMTRQRRIKTPKNDTEPGHTA
jgi:hypothetical protein